MSDLEKYIQEHRDELDRMEPVPTEQLWQKIKAAQVPSAKQKANGRNWKLAALLGLLSALVGWGLLFFGQQDAPTPAQPSVPPATLPKEGEKQVPNGQAPLLQPPPKPASPPVAQQKRDRHKTPKRKPDEPVAAPSVFAEEEKLQQMVALKQQEIGFDTLDQTRYADLLRELDELEISVEQARSDFAGMPQNERLLQTLIRYYELKIRILEQISNEINKQQYHADLEKRI